MFDCILMVWNDARTIPDHILFKLCINELIDSYESEMYIDCWQTCNFYVFQYATSVSLSLLWNTIIWEKFKLLTLSI